MLLIHIIFSSYQILSFISIISIYMTSDPTFPCFTSLLLHDTPLPLVLVFSLLFWFSSLFSSCHAISSMLVVSLPPNFKLSPVNKLVLLYSYLLSIWYLVFPISTFYSCHCCLLPDFSVNFSPSLLKLSYFRFILFSFYHHFTLIIKNILFFLLCFSYH